MTNGVEEESNGAPLGSCDTWSSGRSLSLSGLPDWGQMDEEHRLIAHYAACLAGTTSSPGCESTDSSQSFDPHKTKRELVMALESKNREINRQINKIKEEQNEGGRVNPTLVSELKGLRSHRTQLESHLISLQDSRKSLLGQLESLMRLLKSLKSPPSTSATYGSSTLGGGSSGHRSAPPTPSHSHHYSSVDSLNTQSDSMSSGFSSLKSSFSRSTNHMQRDKDDDRSPDSEGERVRNDLLLAADSVTNAMSSLVRDLNSESSEDESHTKRRHSQFEMGSSSGLAKTEKPRTESSSLQRSRRTSGGGGGGTAHIRGRSVGSSKPTPPIRFN